MSDEGEKLISLTEAAEILGVTRKRVYDFIKDKRLPASKVGKTYVIKENDLNLVVARKTGRPRQSNPSDAALKKRKQREIQKELSVKGKSSEKE